MTTRRQVAVLGLGRFGSALARELARLGHDVLGIDRREKAVQDLSDEVPHVVQADITDADALKDLGLADFDTAIVAISGSIEASILATVLLKRLGVRQVLAKAANELHGSILTQVGADRVVLPEHETGIRVAHSFMAPGIRGYLDVAPGYGIARVAVAGELTGKSLGELDLPSKYKLNALAVSRRGTIILNPHRAEVLRPDDELIVAGQDEDLARLPAGRS